MHRTRPFAAVTVPLALALAVLLAGCSGKGDPGADAETGDALQPSGMRIEGLVQDLGFTPIAGATVTIAEANRTEVTGADGRFAFPPLEAALYTVEAAADGFQPATLLAQPTGGLVGLDFQLTPVVVEQPRNVTVQYKGNLECAFEALILSPSCDSSLVYANDQLEAQGLGRPFPEVFDQNATFDFGVEPGWRTLVVDVAFDPEASPGLDGLRITLRGAGDANEEGTYDQYGRFHGAEPFTARIEPNGTYEDGDTPVPPTSTVFRIEVYPQSHAWHTACDPTDEETCFLGVGGGLDVAFQLLVTAFYVDPAPEGWTLLDGA